MTSEIIVMNSGAVVLAADSAVTLGNGKIFNSANKIFRLVPEVPVGIMVYNKADFMGIPWETIIKLYRDFRQHKPQLSSIEEWKTDLLSFIDCLIPDIEGTAYLLRIVELIAEDIFSSVEQIRNSFEFLEGDVPNAVVEKALAKVLDMMEASQTTDEVLPCLNDDSMRDLVEKGKSVIVDHLPKVVPPSYMTLLSPEICDRLVSVIMHQITHYTGPKGAPHNPFSSGIVIAGFGTTEWFPAFSSFMIVGKILGHLLICDGDDEKFTSMNVQEGQPVTINAFAQHDMISLFMDGIDLDVREKIKSLLESALRQNPSVIFDLIEHELHDLHVIDHIDGEVKQKILDKFETTAEKRKEVIERLLKQIESDHSEGVVEIVANLPKDELAMFAETLVNMTSFKRRISRDAETVGGPIDVAVISKKDGFVWIRRKHYFEPSLNPHFLHELLNY